MAETAVVAITEEEKSAKVLKAEEGVRQGHGSTKWDLRSKPLEGKYHFYV